MLLHVNNVHEKISQRFKIDVNFDSAGVLFVIYIRITTVHSCYIRMPFSANQKRVFFQVHY